MIWGILVFLLSFVLTWTLLPVFRLFAKKVGLMDAPGNFRKVHAKPVPVVGGLLIFTSVFFSFGLVVFVAGTFETFYIIALGISILYLLLGAVDDRHDISAIKKFLVQIICSVVVVKSGVYLSTFNLIFDYDFPIWALQSFTVLLIVGAVNAYNLVDGIDGLLGGFLLLGFIWLLVMAIHQNNQQLSWLILSIVGSLVVFIKQNIAQRAKIFMGDAGALSLGFLLVVCSIYLFENANQNNKNFNWMSMGIVAFLSVPIMDTILVFSRRINRFSSPFKADKTHLHHLLLSLQFSHLKATASILFFAVIMSLISITLSYLGFSVLAFVFIPLFILLLYGIINKWQLFMKSQKIIKSLEKL